MIDRRKFLAGSAAALISAAGAACTGDERSSAAEPVKLPADLAPDDKEWDAVRKQFVLADDVIEMSAMLIASHPKPVRDAIDRHRRGLDERPAEYLHREIGENEDRVFSAAAGYLGAEPGAVALTDSTTAGLGLVYNGIDIGAGQEFLTTEQNYYSTDESIRLKAEKSGASFRRVQLYDDAASATARGLAQNVLKEVKPATRVVALTWVHSSTGLKLPIRLIADGIAEMNADRKEGEQILLAVDGVHGFGVEDVTMADLGCDYFMAGCHKWLFGPRGTGIVWASERGWRNVSPTIPTFIDGSVRAAWLHGVEISGEMTGRRLSPGGFKAFEHQWAMADAFGFIMQIGKGKVAARTHELAGRLKKGLAEMDHVTLVTPVDAELSSGIVCFDVEGMSAHGVVDRLRERRIIATVTPYATTHARVTPSIRNTGREVDTVLDAIRGLA
jgi:selenocysteine lyase/cysteine desulfurase